VIAVRKPTPKAKEPKPLKGRPHRIPDKERNEAFRFKGRRCHWCRVDGGALDLHHYLRRSQGGKDNWSNLIPVHRLCHSYIHEHPAEAKRRGFLA
jgi:5-methylcytosine-specific restriction endonuclease McrA